MKKGKTLMKKTLLTAAVIVTVFAAVNTVSAGEPLLSPRAQANQIKTVPGTTPDMLDRSVKAGSPKGIAFAESFRKVPGTTQEMLVRNTGTTPPRLLANEPWRLQRFQVAPLK
jgi:hypothetical protein